MQADVIYYGANLSEYLGGEFDGTYHIGSPLRIPSWSEFVERNR